MVGTSTLQFVKRVAVDFGGFGRRERGAAD